MRSKLINIISINFMFRMHWLYKEVDALYPSIYLYKENSKIEESQLIYAKMKMVQDTRIILKKPDLKIFVFSKIEYEPYLKPSWFYTKVT